MRARILALALVTACAPLPAAQHASPSAEPSATASEAVAPSVAPETPTSAPSPTPAPPPRVTREIAGIEFALVAGPADLRIESALSRADEATVASTVAADIPAIEGEFERSFGGRPVVYVFATTATYADGFVRIFGYPPATATFVAENSVSFFEPTLRIISVNWDAVRERRPISSIRHELTHLLTLDACAPRCDLVPAWLNEGQARLAEALVPGGEWRLTRVRYESASMAETGTLLPLNTLVSQLAWNALTDWAGYFKYQQAARAVELLREDVGGRAPIARVYDRLRRGQNLAQAYAALTGRSFDSFVSGLPERMRGVVEPARGLIVVTPAGAPAGMLLYGFAPATTVTLTAIGPRGSETWPIVISPFGANFDGLPPTRPRGAYTVSVQDGSATFTVTMRKVTGGGPSDPR